jgi:hypothetical protein
VAVLLDRWILLDRCKLPQRSMAASQLTEVHLLAGGGFPRFLCLIQLAPSGFIQGMPANMKKLIPGGALPPEMAAGERFQMRKKTIGETP